MHSAETAIHHLTELLGTPDVTRDGATVWTTTQNIVVVVLSRDGESELWLPLFSTDGLPSGATIVYAGMSRPAALTDVGGALFKSDCDVVRLSLMNDVALGESLRYLKALRDADHRLPVRRKPSEVRVGLRWLCKAAGVMKYIPGLSAFGNLAADAESLVEGLDRRATAKRVERCERMIERLEKNSERLNRELDQQTENWFLRIFEAAIADDEEEKQIFYSAVLQWIAAESPTTPYMRVVGQAVQELSYLELCAVVEEASGRRLRQIAARSKLDEAFLLERLQRYSLIPSAAVRVNYQQTQFAKVFTDRVTLSDLEA